MRTAVIDIGTNTLLLLIVEPADGGLRPVADVCKFGRLGQGLDASGQLHPEAIARSLEICREYRATMDQHGVTKVAVVGTQALREASNAAAFVGPAEQILGAPIEIIAGAREAELAFGAVRATFPQLDGTPYLVVDVGGGSTEIVATDGARVTSAVSLPIGAVRLTERHLKSDPPSGEHARALIADIDGHLAALDLPRGVPVIGTAGTATTIAAVELKLLDYDPARVTGFKLTATALDRLLARLLELTTAQRRGLRGMVAQRADVIPAGCAILARIVHRALAPELIVCDRGIRWGVAHELAR
jgi:exopolyphosphatase/guanosine-5'-triphosphate,3'-diphosphate pyrophosphatase